LKIPFDPSDPNYVEKIEKRLSYTEYVTEFSDPEPEDVVILGTYSRAWRNKKHREVLTSKAIEFEGRLDSPTSHVRDYVSYCYARRPAKKEQRDILKRKYMPIYADPCIMRDAVYVDIASAWYSIVMLAGWNVEYNPGKWFGFGQPPDDFPFPDNKIARSCMVSLGRSSRLPVWRDGKITSMWMYNNTENLHIWGVIADVLNAIGSHAILLGAKYVNTDGCIISRRYANDMQDYISSWGLSSRIKGEGAAVICGVGAYHIGLHKSGRSMKFHPCEAIDWTVDEDWLKKRVTRSICDERHLYTVR
jgi:hypothetical protein